MKNQLFLSFFLVIAVVAVSDDLLRISNSNSCLRNLVSEFVRAKDCSTLSDQAKAKLATMMTQCLLKQQNKEFPSCPDYVCELKGDAWNSFSIFFTHIDNLCHFYWETLREERSQILIQQLSESSIKAQQTLRENREETQKILKMQQKLHQSIDESLKSQAEMSFLLNSSATHLVNLTKNLEIYVESIHSEIEQNYESIRRLLHIINEGMTHMLEIQGYLKAEVTSFTGILFFIAQFLIIVFFTTGHSLQATRIRLILLLFIEAFIELTFASFVRQWITIAYYRYFFIFIKVTITFTTSGSSSGEGKNILATSQIDKMKGRSGFEGRDLWNDSSAMSCLAVRIVEQMRERELWEKRREGERGVKEGEERNRSIIPNNPNA